MKSYRQWQEEIGPIMNNLGTIQTKPWKASKKETLDHWQHMPPAVPLGQIRAVPPDYKGSSMKFDGLRITGSPQFIDYVLSRLKDILAYESEQTRLQLIYKQQIDNKTKQPVPNSYVLYMQVMDR